MANSEEAEVVAATGESMRMSAIMLLVNPALPLVVSWRRLSVLMKILASMMTDFHLMPSAHTDDQTYLESAGLRSAARL